MRAQLFTALFVLLAVAAPTNAQKRTLAEAQKVAENFFLANDNKTAVSLLRINNKSGRHLLKKAHDEKQAEAFYLFTDEREKQLLIVSGDERMQRILGYTDRPLAGNAIPDGLADLLDGYTAQYNATLRLKSYLIYVPQGETFRPQRYLGSCQQRRYNARPFGSL